MSSRLLLLLSALLVGCPSASDEDAVDDAPESAVYSVSISEASTERVVDPVIVTGVVGPTREVRVLSEAAGRVTKLQGRLGQTVSKATPLAQLDSTVARAQLDQAAAAAEQAAANLDLAEAEYARVSTLHAQGATTDRDHDASKIQVRSATAQRQAAHASVSLAERGLADTTLRAPFGGELSAVHIELGAVIAPGTPAFDLVDLSEAVVRAGISGREVPLVSEGQSVLVRVPSLGERTFEGTVQAVAPSSDPRSRTWPVEVVIPNADRALRGGMVARVEIVVGERDGVQVPDGAVVEGKAGPRIFVIADGAAQERQVTLGRAADGKVEVRAGVESGEVVAVLGSQRLSDGAKVTVYEMGESAAKATLPPSPE
ncbi:MAG: efflux RND transporter periplasmic adaptor subunit [Deltaproteobacteria bacterium]|nr:efflux RND transporter periplasmic adaptor subunit [Deltaproteobacteria bacterium]